MGIGPPVDGTQGDFFVRPEQKQLTIGRLAALSRLNLKSM